MGTLSVSLSLSLYIYIYIIHNTYIYIYIYIFIHITQSFAPDDRRPDASSLLLPFAAFATVLFATGILRESETAIGGSAC